MPRTFMAVYYMLCSGDKEMHLEENYTRGRDPGVEKELYEIK